MNHTVYKHLSYSSSQVNRPSCGISTNITVPYQHLKIKLTKLTVRMLTDNM